jgi:uncharacterized cupin superfamily protein
MPKLDLSAIPVREGCGYPAPYHEPCAGRTRQRLGDAGGLKDFGVNLMTLPPGGWSSQRHWHSHEDEFVYVLEGELTLVEDEGETLLRAGDCAAFPKSTGNGHHMKNLSATVAVYLEVGSRQREDLTTCSDVDIKSANADGRRAQGRFAVSVSALPLAHRPGASAPPRFSHIAEFFLNRAHPPP